MANTIGKFVDLSTVDAHLAVLILFCGLLGAIVWNLATWWFGIPSSSSHALVGGLAGAVVAAVGSEYVIWGWTPLMHEGKLLGVMKVLVSLFLSPVLGFCVGFLIFRLARKVMASARPTANQTLRKLQFLTAAGLAFSHGANDAQKSMGMLTLVLLLGGFIPKFEVPFWVILACATAITLGILSGGWRIVRTARFCDLSGPPTARVFVATHFRAVDPFRLVSGRTGIDHARGRHLDHGYRLFRAPPCRALEKGG